MRVTDSGVRVEDLVDTVKRSVRAANISRTRPDRDLRISGLRLTLNVIATRSAGGGLDFRLPFIGTEVKVGTKLTTKNTHTITMSLTPPDLAGQPEMRYDDIESVFVDAITTIRATMARAAGGDDPFVLTEGSVEIAFAVSREGTIKLGVDGTLSEDITHTLTLALVATPTES